MALMPLQQERDESEVSEDIFVDNLPEYLRCPICLCCLTNPYQVGIAKPKVAS